MSLHIISIEFCVTEIIVENCIATVQPVRRGQRRQAEYNIAEEEAVQARRARIDAPPTDIPIIDLSSDDDDDDDVEAEDVRIVGSPDSTTFTLRREEEEEEEELDSIFTPSIDEEIERIIIEYEEEKEE